MLGTNILLASHDSPGARAAENYLLKYCRSEHHITHLIVVPEFWRGMLGDDWLNTSKTRKHFSQYLETTLGQEIDQHVQRLRSAMQENELQYQVKLMRGDPMQCLLNMRENADEFDTVVMGSLRPKRQPGLRSRMLSKKLLRHIQVPLIIVPYPQ